VASQETDVSEELIESYRRDGFARVQGVLAPEEVERYRQRALELAAEGKGPSYRKNPFVQRVNVWRRDSTMRELTLHPRLAELAEALAGVQLRLWHDHILIKEPHVSTPTEFHFDAPDHPLHSDHQLSAWVALVDVPVERGCMSFIPGSHRGSDHPNVDLEEPQALEDAVPELTWAPRVTVPLRAGDCTFHHGLCAHAAGANVTDIPRVAHVIIYMDADARFTGAEHLVTDPLGLEPRQLLDQEIFPFARASA
jgi:ectoine hydroxylase-related dioxygenase (phytanoyl-CoA dioxygenase family)